MQRYENYKDSGVDWIGEIPEHWETPKITYLFNKIGSGTTPTAGSPLYYENGTINFLQTGDLNDGYINDTSKKITVKTLIDYSSLKLFPKGSLVIAMYGATIGKLGILNIETTTNQACCVLGKESENVELKFVFYWFHFAKPHIISMSYGGGQPNISQDLVKSLRLQMPPIEEQQTIATFLDDKTAKIDQTIANKQKEIELLKERRQILIQKAVTKGLDDTVPLKDSGVDWIGEIPEHWEVRKLKAFCKAFGRIGFRGYTTADLVDEGEGVITISPSNIKENEMVFDKNSFLSWHKYNESPEIKIRENDILIVKTGSTYGKIGIVKKMPQKATINPQLLVLKDIKINPDYLYELLKSEMFQIQVEKNVIGSTIPTISETKILGFSVPMPKDEKEFNTISDYIYEVNEKLFALIKLKQQEIEKLKEYKTVLIDNVVTGKVRVTSA